MEKIAGPGCLSYYGDSMTEYEGEGIIALDGGKEFRCEFRTGQFTNGNIVLICSILPIEIHRINIRNWKEGFVRANCLKGQTRDGKLIKAKKLEYPMGSGVADDLTVVFGIFQPGALQIDMKKGGDVDGISFGITNFGFKGISFEHPNYTEFLELNLSGKKVAIWKPNHYDEIIDRMKLIGEARITCEIWAEISQTKEIKQMEKMVGDLCFVLSIASGSKVQWIYRDLHCGDARISSLNRLVPDKPYSSRSIIDNKTDPQTMASFVETAYSSFVSNIERFGEVNGVPRIMAAIDTFIDARIGPDFLQIKGIKFASTMEIIKEMLQVWMPKKKYLSGSKFKKMSDEIRGALKPILSKYLPELRPEEAFESFSDINRPSFRTILENGFNQMEFSVKESELDLFVKSRNSLIHQGRFYCETATSNQKKACKPLRDINEEYMFISDFLSKVFLVLFRYQSALNNLGNRYLVTGQFENAKISYQEAVRFEEENATPWYGLGNAYRYLCQYAKSAEAYSRAIDLSKRPGKELIQLYALNNVGSLLWIEGDLEGAVKANNEAIELDQNFCAAHISLAASYKKMGKKAELDKELGIINKLIANESKYNQACFEAILGNADTAIRYLRIAMLN